MWFREQGHVFDWGSLKWCQTYDDPPNGCFDVETIALDEFGHVEGLDHHANYSDDRDYDDAVVQTVSRAKPTTGWNMHVFGRCDVATLQREYDVPNVIGEATRRASTWTTVLTLAAAPTSIAYGATTTLTATLKVASIAAYDRLKGNLVTGRIVTLQRRPSGSTTWATVGTMTPGEQRIVPARPSRCGRPPSSAPSSRPRPTKASTATRRRPSPSRSGRAPSSPCPLGAEATS